MVKNSIFLGALHYRQMLSISFFFYILYANAIRNVSVHAYFSLSHKINLKFTSFRNSNAHVRLENIIRFKKSIIFKIHI